ncbi:hypothetical protein EV363DRAFT_1295733 [Boletus edulis]|nr:hypothetical protein EV363DRAFT_1295733 [Boletus edulis]
MAPTHPWKKAPRRSGKGSKDKTLAAPPSPLVPTVQMARPVSGPAAPDGRFGYQVPAPIPTFVGSRPVAEFQQDRTKRSATRSISAKGKTLGASTKVEATRPASGPDHHPTHGIQPSCSPATRSDTPAQSSRLPRESLHLHVSPTGDQQLRSRHAQLAMSDGGRSSQSLSEEEDESDHPNMALKYLSDIEEGKEEGEEQEGDEMQEEDEEKEEDKLEEECEEEQEEDMELDDLYGGASTQGDALANSANASQQMAIVLSANLGNLRADHPSINQIPETMIIYLSMVTQAMDIVDQCSVEIRKAVPFCYITDFGTSDDWVEAEMKCYLSRNRRTSREDL